ncbi:MAG: P-loop NTPase [Gammaproteobacteria bacterium]|nr:Mrp/NBP35 family ATP-binding protein [Gemmatimonadota bacterium]NIU80112.1 P-loop NTPase [Gammaproteobacteria bacterium]NIX25621.1 P-loop NTPase [Actinomycetota bacterium]
MIAVTVPSRLSRFVVRKSVTLARRQGTPLLGYVENMSGYACPDCGRVGPLFDAEAGSGPFEDIERLASLPFDPRFGRESDAGRPGILERPESGVARELHDLASKLRARLEGSRT